MWSKLMWVGAAMLLLAGGFAANAQGTGNDGRTTTTGQSSNRSSENGKTSVKTGRGPLSQPLPPAVSTTNPGQNLQQSPQRPAYSPGPAMTNPSQQPFGTR
jgi:hypothetical protein